MDKFRYTKPGQMLDVLKTHAINAFVFSMLWMAFVMIWANSVGSYVFAVIAVFSYFLGIYGCGERAAKNDKKSYVPGDPDIKKCLYIPILLIVVNLVFVGLYKLTWVLGSDGETIQEIWSVVTNIISIVWFAAFGTLAGMDKGSFSVLGIILVVFLPYISYTLGYYAGMKNFDINEKLFGFMYEKKK